jgi:hypothetical protein
LRTFLHHPKSDCIEVCAKKKTRERKKHQRFHIDGLIVFILFLFFVESWWGENIESVAAMNCSLNNLANCSTGKRPVTLKKGLIEN